MNNLLIEKLIKSNNETCPEFTYSNPLLDKNVTKALSKSLINILKISSQNSSVNNSLRLSVLENIRKLCVDHPEGHLKFDDNATELLITLYGKQMQESNNTSETVDQTVDNFFVTNYKELNINSSSKCIQNPEVIQALLNLSNKKYLDIISKSIIHWNIEDPRYYKLSKELWNNNYEDINFQDTLSIKVKCEIERHILEVSHYVLDKKENKFESVISHYDNFNNITNICSTSCECFQICCSILNFIFIVTNFDSLIQSLIQGFIKKIKSRCQDKLISLLYPLHLRHIVVLLDIEICEIPLALKESYLQTSVKYLKKLHEDNEPDLILLLSHFPFWFDNYFSK